MTKQGPHGIGWCDYTTNPVKARDRATGKQGWFCVRVSQGCKFCYAARLNQWRGTGHDYSFDNLEKVELYLDEKELTALLRHKGPSSIFPGDMTDLFLTSIPDEWLDRFFAVVALTPWNTYRVLTKRADRMRQYFRDPNTPGRIQKAANVTWEIGRWPLPNLQLGVSIEDQPTADERIPLLLRTPAAVRFVSYEPALGPVTFWHDTEAGRMSWLKSYNISDDPTPRINWVIPGGESGPDARAARASWFRAVRDECEETGTPLFFKQWGEWLPGEPPAEDIPRRVGKRAAGYLLDGKEWRMFPGDVHIPIKRRNPQASTETPGNSQ